MDFSEEEENIEEVLQNEDIERFETENDNIQSEHEDNENKDDDDNEEEARKVVKPKKVFRPRLKLNAEVLKGPKGLGALEKIFEKVKFKGKGYEDHDLNVLLKCYEYWCHRMFPKFPFEDCIEKIEALGHKGPIQTYLKKMRSGLLDPSEDIEDNIAPEIRSDEENDTQATAPMESKRDEPMEITEEQLERIRLNRERAEKLRKERLQNIQNKASADLPQCSEPITFVNNDEPLDHETEQSSQNINKEPTEEDEISHYEKVHETEEQTLQKINGGDRKSVV